MYVGHSFIFLIIYEGDPWEETWAWHTSFWSGCFKTCFIKVTNYTFGSASIHGICCTHCTQCLWSKKIMRTVQQHCSTRKILLVVWRKIAQHDKQFCTTWQNCSGNFDGVLKNLPLISDNEPCIYMTFWFFISKMWNLSVRFLPFHSDPSSFCHP